MPQILKQWPHDTHKKRLLILCLLTVIAVVEIVSAGQGREVPCFGTELEEWKYRELFYLISPNYQC